MIRDCPNVPENKRTPGASATANVAASDPVSNDDGGAGSSSHAPSQPEPPAGSGPDDGPGDSSANAWIVSAVELIHAYAGRFSNSSDYQIIMDSAASEHILAQDHRELFNREFSGIQFRVSTANGPVSSDSHASASILLVNGQELFIGDGIVLPDIPFTLVSEGKLMEDGWRISKSIDEILVTRGEESIPIKYCSDRLSYVLHRNVSRSSVVCAAAAGLTRKEIMDRMVEGGVSHDFGHIDVSPFYVGVAYPVAVEDDAILGDDVLSSVKRGKLFRCNQTPELMIQHLSSIVQDPGVYDFMCVDDIPGNFTQVNGRYVVDFRTGKIATPRVAFKMSDMRPDKLVLMFDGSSNLVGHNYLPNNQVSIGEVPHGTIVVVSFYGIREVENVSSIRFDVHAHAEICIVHHMCSLFTEIPCFTQE